MTQSIKQFFSVNRYFLLFMFLFSYLVVVKGRFVARQELNWLTFTPEGPIAVFIGGLFAIAIIKLFMLWLKIDAEVRTSRSRYLALFTCALAVYLVFGNLTGYAIAWSFDKVDLNFNRYTLIANNLNRAIDFFFFASLFLAYDHIQKAASYKERLANYNSQLASMKLQQVRAQLDPHFIFNCLNTLDELIEASTADASQYLNEFAELYRIAIRHSKESLVPLDKEIAFAQHYFNLMEKRLPRGFSLKINTLSNPALQCIPPFGLQLLVENALVHNQASESSPVEISIQIDNKITVCNTFSPTAKSVLSHGTGLDNLIAQYAHLTDQKVNIEQKEGRFTVTLPSLEHQNHV